MNVNRIVELAAKASNGVDPAQVCAVGIRPQFVTKFAELIVQECTDICNQNGGSSWSSAELIKEHFGVK